MSVVRVALPVFRGKRRFHLLKGRPWSPIEHLILQALVSEPRTAATLSELSALPRRVVIEALIRLMRADWVEVSPQPAGTLFRATPGGREKAPLDDLPNFPKPISRWMTFVIDRITGTTFRRGEFPVFERHVVEQRAQHESIVWLEPSQAEILEEPRAIFSALLDDDETIVDVDAAGDRLVERFALILVRNGKAEGLPKAAAQLEGVINDAADRYATTEKPSQRFTVKATVEPQRLDGRIPTTRTIGFQQGDLILGGDAHKNALLSLIRKARERVLIHSTFVSASTLNDVMPTILDAARRGVAVDILWGQNEDRPEAHKTQEVLAAARAQVAALSLDTLISIHPFSTHSHAKLLFADDGQTGRDVAIVGSCNWLSSGFHSFEASVRLRDPQIVADVLDVLTDLSLGRDSFWKPLTTRLGTIARDVRSRPPLAGARLTASVVLGAQHGHFVREARDRAAQRIFVASHRLGAAAKQAVIIPAVAAARHRGIETQVYFGKPSDQMTGRDAAELTLDAGKDGIHIRPVFDPRLHAKILAWDDDSVLITSQNWLSSDPSYDSALQEVGVFLKGGRIADNVITTFLNSRRS
ncbi:phospholipase D-like domain-containing protein [Neorhizobium petrolearium]|uniref:phospholipase D-like domain-containing protein n=1 Tax=Neorhizobium petrolearium TaxID=515361 RepID=UPI003F165998